MPKNIYKYGNISTFFDPSLVGFQVQVGGSPQYKVERKPCKGDLGQVFVGHRVSIWIDKSEAVNETDKMFSWNYILKPHLHFL